MNYEKYVLTAFLDKYERSRDFLNGKRDGTVLLNMDSLKELDDILENASEKAEFLHVLQNLEQNKLISITWVKFEEGNLVDKIYLQNINQAYILMNRQPKEDLIHAFRNMIINVLSSMKKDTALKEYLKLLSDECLTKKKIPSNFCDDLSFDKDLLKFLILINDNTHEQMERVFSTSLYSDSKYFERNIRSKALNILRHIYQQENGEIIDDASLLEQYGITRWPEVMEFCGDMTIFTDNQSKIDYYHQIYGSYINSAMIPHISSISAPSVHDVLFIENKANYIWYVMTMKRPDQLIIYHGGVYSPAKGKWFSQIHQALLPETPVSHWSDIDVGGFRIFSRLTDIFPELIPYQMDVKTLSANSSKCMPLGTQHYIEILKQMKEDERYKIFGDTIQYMLEHNIKLEQENLINE